MIELSLTFLAFVVSANVESTIGGKPVVLAPVALSDAGGRRTDDSTLDKARAGLAKAATVRGARLRAIADASVSVPAARALPEPLQKLANEARTAADELDTKKGVSLHRDLIGKLQASLGDHGDVEALVDARLSLASLYLAMDEKALARTELDAAARLRPNAELDLSRWPPQMADAFMDAQKRVRGESGGSLDVKTAPDGGAVFLDAVRMGQSPLSDVKVPRGIHLVEVVLPGHATLRRAVDVQAGGNTALTDRLTADAAFEVDTRLRAELAGPDRRAESLGLARSLARLEKAPSLVVTGVIPVAGGFAVVLSRVAADGADGGDDPRVVVVTLDPTLTGAESAFAKALAALEEPAGAFSGGVSRLRGEGAPEPDAVEIDAKSTLLGIRRTPVAPTAVVITGPASTGGTGLATAAPAAVDEESSVPWLWIAVGTGAALLVAAGATVAAVLFITQQSAPEPEPIQDPDKTTLEVGVAP